MSRHVEDAPGPTSRERRSQAGFDLTPPTKPQFAALAADLTEEERDVLLHHGTEAPFCGVFNAHKGKGAYVCRLCGLPLFRSGTKFESGTDGRASAIQLIGRISNLSGTRATA